MGPVMCSITGYSRRSVLTSIAVFCVASNIGSYQLGKKACAKKK